MNYLFDTNILLYYLRTSPTQQKIEQQYAPFDKGNTAFLCVVSVGEIFSLAMQNHWGKGKFQLLELLLTQFVITDIHSEDVIQKYAEIDAYSQGKLLGKPLNTTARNMGKNDLWIAATASTLAIPLLSLDNDFQHLDKVYVDLLKV